MKIIFLDIDGVINSLHDYIPKNNNSPIHHLSPKYISRLNTIINVTGAKVVISSMWRIGYRLSSIEVWLKQQGFIGEIVGETPILPESKDIDRGDEIKFWLNSNDNIESFVILDDIDYNGIVKYYYPQFVHVKKSTGLLPKHVEKAIRILEKK